MAISRISAASAQAAHVAISTPTKGDLIVVGVHRDGSATNGTLLAGYTSMSATGANTNAMRLAYKFSDGTETDTGTWASATSIACMVYRGVDLNVPIGSINTAGATVANGATMSYPALSPMQIVDNTSWVAAFGAGRTTTNVGTNAPSGMTTETSATDIAGFDTNATATSWSAHTATVTASSTSGYRTVVFELRAAPSAPSWVSNDPLIQHVSSSIVAEGTAVANTFKIWFPNTTLANNLLLLVFSHDTGKSVTSVTDSNSITWTAGPTAVGGAATADSRLYYVLGAAATSWVTVVLSASVQDFEYKISEFTGVKTATAVDGTATGSNAQTAPLVQSGSITTTAAGDLIYQYARYVNNIPFYAGVTAASGIAADSNFLLLSAARNTCSADQYSVQAASGAINPALAFAGNAQTFNSLSIAFKIDGSGTARPAGMRIVNVHSEVNFGPTTPFTAQFPCLGNLIVFGTGDQVGSGTISSPSDSSGNTYGNDSTTDSQLLYAVNATTSRALSIKMSIGNSLADLLRFYDIVGAAAAAHDQTGHNSGTQGSAAQTIVDAPDITPTTSNGVVIAMGNIGNGPFTGVALPSGAIIDDCHYTGETDAGWMNQGGFSGHYNNPNTTAEAWSWTNASPSASSWYCIASSFKPAATGTLKTEIGLAIASTKTMVGLAAASLKTALGLTP